MMMDLPLNVDFSGKVVVVTGAGGVLCVFKRNDHANQLPTQDFDNEKEEPEIVVDQN